MLRGFGIIPLFGGFIFFIGSIMQLMAMVIAVKTAVGYTSVGRATGVVLIGAVPYVIIYAIVFAILTLESHRGGSVEHQIVSLHAGYDYKGHTVDGYIARPSDPGTHPPLIVISGMSGLNAFQREMTRVFARAGFVSLSPDLFDGYSAPDHASALLAKNSLDIDQTINRLSAGAEWLRKLPWVDDKAKVGVVGFCLGGGLALYCMGRSGAFAAGGIYYQSMFPDPAELAGITGKLQCHYGTADKSTPAEEIERFRTEIDLLGIKNEVHFYEGMGHGFLHPRQEAGSNREQAAALSLERTFAFFHEELSATPAQVKEPSAASSAPAKSK